MHYMLCFRQTDADFALENDPEGSKAYWGAWMAYVGALQASGKVVSGNGLLPPKTAAIVRIRDGKRQVQDGPYPDTREHLGGYFIIDVETVDEALEWAARAPCASTGSIEVRPCMTPPDMDAKG